MDGRTELNPPGELTPDACRRFFHGRGDVSLGLVPQLLLDAPRADLWGYFWYAARLADDDVENRRADWSEYAERLERPTSHPADRALGLFLDRLPADAERALVKAELATSLEALGRERAMTGPPALAEYAEIVRDKAGVPLTILNRLLLPGEDDASVRRFSRLLALSIQLGDDVRDRTRDAQLGLHTVTREELDLARQRYPEDPDPAAVAIAPWREAASRWLAILALERTERFQDAAHRAAARVEVLLWLRAIDAGQLRDVRRPMRWPPPLGELLRDGPPSAARMAAARRVVQHDPAVLGDTRKWDPRNRLQELQATQRAMPSIYETLEKVARPE
jgi:hypothetical protein